MTSPGPDSGPTGSRLVLTGYLESKYIYLLKFTILQVKNTINAQDMSNDVYWAFFVVRVILARRPYLWWITGDVESMCDACW